MSKEISIAQGTHDIAESIFNKIVSTLTEDKRWIAELAEYRAFKCKPCANAGKCRGCGCATPGIFFVTGRNDSENKWGPVKDKEEWKKFKKTDDYKEFNSSRLADVRKGLSESLPYTSGDFRREI